ncbi:MAG: carboxypeptidase-like regulatory domain-containing protein [Bacteroidetes bacterium]|nr:carboxypeptidase-like regulatory domain-containing protein [Bacteroidota bacterium]
MQTLKKIEKFVALCFFATTVHAQTCRVSGKITNAKTFEPLPMASVFLNNTTIGTMSDANGDFVLENISQPSTHELVVSFLGYEPYKTKLSLSVSELKLGVIRLRPSDIELATVEVSASKDVEWEKKLKKFKKIFLGDDKAAEQCTILNPWVIDFQNDTSGKKIVATAGLPIEIENRALGYKVNFYLSAFAADNTNFLIKGNARFEPLKNTNEKVLTQWERNRERSYYHSVHHLFKAIVHKRINGEGFNLYTDILGSGNNPNIRSSLFKSNLGNTVAVYDTANMVLSTSQKDIFSIAIRGRFEVHYRNEQITKRIYQDIDYPVSWIIFTKNSVLVNKEGILVNPSDIVIEGAMSQDRVAHMLPLDYQPIGQLLAQAAENRAQVIAPFLDPFYEKIYVHTDKDYYYPSETLWFKGYTNYSAPSFRDSLSRIVYVEFIQATTRKVVLSKTLPLDSGMFNGEFILPDTLKSSDCYLRAYTNLNRNFGDDNLYMKHFPVLNPLERPELTVTQKPPVSESLKVTTGKSSYAAHEKITLIIQMKNEEGNPIEADLSVSVTDTSKVVSLAGSNILSDFPIHEIPKAKNFTYQAEYGIGFRAKINDENNKPTKMALNILQVNPRNFFMTETDEQGVFSLTNLNFYDTSRFSFQIVKGKKQIFGKAELLARLVPPFSYQSASKPFKIVSTQFPQNQQSTFDIPKGARLLKEVEVKATNRERPYGKPDYILKSTDLNTKYGNLLITLPGKVPGLIVRQSDTPAGMRWVVYTQRGATSSLNFSGEVAVLVNNTLRTGAPGDILGSIDPGTVESIEVTTRANSLLGNLGCCGVINIFTKSDLSQNYEQKNVPVLKISGYSKPRNFTAPDYDKMKVDPVNGDNRALLYWNPNVVTNNKTGEATVSFYASDNVGQYRAIVEGVTKEGKPVHSECLITVSR